MAHLAHGTRTLWSAGSALIVCGGLHYACVRTAERMALWPQALSANAPLIELPELLSGALPGFLHTLGFALLTAAAVGRRSALIPAGLFWALVNVAFEAGQHPDMSRLVAAALNSTALPGSAATYFVYGTFDVLDVGAIVLALLLAIVIADPAARRVSG